MYIHVERAKTMLTNRWIYGYVDRHPYNTCLIGDVNVNGKTVGKYTGIRDNTAWDELTESQKREFVHILFDYSDCKHVAINTAHEYWKGHAIFEGDIIDGRCIGADHHYVVGRKFDMWGLYDGTNPKMSNFIAFDQLPFATFKVIGNIYDNPELMSSKGE